VVARAIQDQMLGREESHVLLDISHKPASKVQKKLLPLCILCLRNSGVRFDCSLAL
jgi:aspartate oxidase